MIRSENLRNIFYGLGMIAIQFILLRHLTIYGAESDLVLLFILWLCISRSKTECLLYAGAFGLIQDALMDLWGLHMFSKTLLVFILHGQIQRIAGNRFIFWQIFLLILIAAFIHNFFFFSISSFSEVFATSYVGVSLLLVSSVFTAVVGSFLYLVKVDT